MSGDFDCPFCAWRNQPRRDVQVHLLLGHLAIAHTVNRPAVLRDFYACGWGAYRLVFCWCGEKILQSEWAAHIEAAGGVLEHVLAQVLMGAAR